MQAQREIEEGMVWSQKNVRRYDHRGKGRKRCGIQANNGREKKQTKERSQQRLYKRKNNQLWGANQKMWNGRNSWPVDCAVRHLQEEGELVVVSSSEENKEFVQPASENKDFMLACVRQLARTLAFASTNLKNDKELVLVAVRRCECALQYASEHLKNDTEVVAAAINGGSSCSGCPCGYDSGRWFDGGWYSEVFLRFASNQIKCKVRVFQALVRNKNEILCEDALFDVFDERLQALVANRDGILCENTLSDFLDEQFSLYGAFGKLSGIIDGESHCEIGRRHIPEYLMESISEYAGVPSVIDIYELQRVREILPLVSAVGLHRVSSNVDILRLAHLPLLRTHLPEPCYS